MIDLNSIHHEDELFFSSMGVERKDALQAFLTTLVESANSPEAARLLDYRQYFDYNLTVTDIRDPDSKPIRVDKQSGEMSGGEYQNPYFVAILASYLHAYNRHESRRKEPSLALVPIDEPFRNSPVSEFKTASKPCPNSISKACPPCPSATSSMPSVNATN